MLITLLAMLDSEEDRRILSALYEENHDRMEQTAIRILNDPRDAEDAVQNAFIKVIGSYEKIFEIPREEIPFWLVCIVKNEAISMYGETLLSMVTAKPSGRDLLSVSTAMTAERIETIAKHPPTAVRRCC